VVQKEKKTDLGTLRINNEVIASIARNAALQINGVAGIKAGTLALISDLFNKGYSHRGISLDISENEVNIGITIIVKYGVNIPEVAALVQENIRATVEEMTGLNVAEVNINNGDIHAEHPEK